MTILCGARPFSLDLEAVASGSYSSQLFSAEASDVPHHSHCRRLSDGWVVGDWGAVSHTFTVKAKAKVEMNLLNLFQRLNPDNYPAAKTILDGLKIKPTRHQHWFIFGRRFFVLFVCVFLMVHSVWELLNFIYHRNRHCLNQFQHRMASTQALEVDRVISETLVDLRSWRISRNCSIYCRKVLKVFLGMHPLYKISLQVALSTLVLVTFLYWS